MGNKGDIVRQKDTGYGQIPSGFLPSDTYSFILAGTKKPPTLKTTFDVENCRIGLISITCSGEEYPNRRLYT